MLYSNHESLGSTYYIGGDLFAILPCKKDDFMWLLDIYYRNKGVRK